MFKPTLFVITVGSENHASSRIRMVNYFEQIKETFNLTWMPLRGYRDYRTEGKASLTNSIDKYWRLLKTIFFLLGFNYDYVVVQKEIVASWLLKHVKRKGSVLIFDMDDAIYLAHQNNFSDYLNLFDKIIVSTPFLAERFKDIDTPILVIPSSVFLPNLAENRKLLNDQCIHISWIGSPSTSKYLTKIHDALLELSKSCEVQMHIMGATIQLDGVNCAYHDWSIENERTLLSNTDVGIMPLDNTEWETMKGGYKLLLYMSYAIPVIADAVGTNTLIIQHGINGYLAQETSQWLDYFNLLLSHKEEAIQTGTNGRKTVETTYSYDVNASRLIQFIKN